MSKLVPASKIEGIVGARRHPTNHQGRAVSAEQTVYVLHSKECLDSGIDLRRCPFSVAMDTDEGITKALEAILDVANEFAEFKKEAWAAGAKRVVCGYLPRWGKHCD